jgi:hypothetical protein
MGKRTLGFRKMAKAGQVQWLTTVIPDTWEAEIGRIMVGGQSR